MRPRAMLAALVAVSLLLVAATAALAQDAGYSPSATMNVDATVLPDGTLGLQVDEGRHLGVAVPGQPGEVVDFHFEVLNTTDDGWEVDVFTDEFFRFYWEICDDEGCRNPLPADEPTVAFDGDNLFIMGGDWSWDDEPYRDDVTATDVWGEGTIMEGAPTAYGRLGFHPGPRVQLHVPAGFEDESEEFHPFVDFGEYHSTVTFTIAAVTD